MVSIFVLVLGVFIRIIALVYLSFTVNFLLDKFFSNDNCQKVNPHNDEFKEVYEKALL